MIIVKRLTDEFKSINKFVNTIFRVFYMEKLYKFLTPILLAIIAFFFVAFFNQTIALNKELQEIKLSIVKIENTMMSEDCIRRICINEIYRYHDRHHVSTQTEASNK